MTGIMAALFAQGSSAFAWDFEHDFTSETLPTGTFARTGSGTRVNSSGVIETITANNPRYGYDPLTLAARGLLMEKASTNLFTNSTGFNANWTGVQESGVDAYSTAPDGATATTRLIDNSAGGSAAVRYSSPSVTVATTTDYSCSIFMKADQLSIGRVATQAFTTPGDTGTYFNLSSGAVGTTGTGHTARAVGYADSWWRDSISFTTDAVDTSGTIRIGPAQTDGVINVDLDGTSSIIMWGVQFEASAYATSYIPTSGGTATRGAETLIDTTISYWNGTTGTFYIEAMIYAPSGDHVIWMFDDNTDNERHMIWANGTSIKYTVTDGGSTVAELTLGTYTPYTAFKIAAAFAANDIAAVMNGGTTQTDASATLPTVDRSRYGHGRTSDQLDGWLKIVKFDGTRQDNTFLEGLVA